MPGKKKGKKGKSAKVKSDPVIINFEDKDELLQTELDDLNKEIEKTKTEVISLKQDNERLQEEANRVRMESHEYMAFIEKKTNKRQSSIISLSDFNRHEIEKIKNERAKLENHYSIKKKELEDIIIEKESVLAKTKAKLENLSEYKALQEEQTDTIHKLEKEIMIVRRDQTHKLNDMKQKFIREKEECQTASEKAINETIQRANKAAVEHLNEHTDNLKLQNQSLRRQLLKLIRQTRILQTHKDALEEQYKELLREQQYARDLKTIRNAKHSRIIKLNEQEQLKHEQILKLSHISPRAFEYVPTDNNEDSQ